VKADFAHEVELFTHHMRAPQPSWRLRVRVRCSAGALERRLADGANPLASPTLALRARQLLDRRTRRSLARSINVLVRSAQETRRRARFRTGVAVDAAAVQAADSDLRALAERLLDDQPVAERGVAMASVLLRDGCGPVYDPNAPLPLRYCVRMALLCLDP
jgi:hypothetical protein